MKYYNQHKNEEWFRYRYYENSSRKMQRNQQYLYIRELITSNIETKEIPCLMVTFEIYKIE